MTRNQMLEKMPHYRNYGEQAIKGWLLDNLEALGLIKIEVENPYQKYGITKDNLKALDQAGYEITPKVNYK